MKTTHTPEPWQYWANYGDAYTLAGIDGEVREIIGEVGSEEDAARIVACVNYCKGISNSGLSTMQSAETQLEILAEKTQERNELLAALKELVDNETMCTIHWEVMNPIKELINKIENK